MTRIITNYRCWTHVAEHVYGWLKVLLFFVAVVALGLLCQVLWHLDNSLQALRQVPQHTTETLAQAKVLFAHLDQRLNGTDDRKPQNTAVLPAMTQAIRDVRQTAVDANWASKQYYVDLKTLTDDLGDRFRDQVFGDRGTVSRLNTSITQVTDDSHLVLVNTSSLLRQATIDMEILARVIGDPELTATIKHLDGTAGNVEQTTASLALLMADVQGKVHEQTHPSKRQRALTSLLNLVKLSYYISQLR